MARARVGYRDKGENYLMKKRTIAALVVLAFLVPACGWDGVDRLTFRHFDLCLESAVQSPIPALALSVKRLASRT